MEMRSKPQARALVSSALLMAVAGGLVSTLGTRAAMADLSDIPLLAGAHADGMTLSSAMSGVHTFGSSENFYAPASAYFITVSSGSLGGDDYYVNVDWNPFDPGYFLGAGINYLLLQFALKDPAGGGTPITDLTVFDGTGAPVADLDAGGFGLSSFDGFNVSMSLDIADLVATGGITRLEFSQVPAPGALAMLGLAGLAGRRRRR